jgi:mannose-6-phosphate isomerase-like protein (cupin superfamily)
VPVPPEEPAHTAEHGERNDDRRQDDECGRLIAARCEERKHTGRLVRATTHAWETCAVGYTVLRPEDQVFAAPSWRPDEPDRSLVELPLNARFRHSQAHVWRYPPGAYGRRHREPIQEEVFCVVEGTLTMLLGDSAERFELPRRSVVVVEPGTALQLRNESDEEVIVFAYGAPHQPSDYQAEVVSDPD